MPAVVDVEKCDGCKTCEENCPTSSIKVGDSGKAEVIADECIDCAACVADCVQGAVTMA
jgi:NAD-dependent dihydropyrimidine dehydrogenase PreA subunit